MRTVYIIAEAGVNHNGNRERAFKLVDVAVKAGADVVKFQTFKADNLATKSADKAAYQKKTTDSAETHFEMLKRLELPLRTHYELAEYCKNKKIEFLSTAFDLDSLDFLANALKLKTLKIPSGEITNAPLLLAQAQTGCNLILSTGMATLGEIEEALGVLAFGLINDKTIKPSRASFQQAYCSIKGQESLKEKVTILHCTSEYPAPPQEINLKAMQTMRTAFGLQTGYSDHSEGITVPIAATAMGATLIEKHFTLDKTLPGPDHKSSLEPEELNTMVNAIRTVELVLGSGVKAPMPSEWENRDIARKSLVATKEIKQGEKFSEDNLIVKRPGIGISPMEYWDMIGKTAQANIEQDTLIN
jgi:N-acetylneuraminate synthase